MNRKKAEVIERKANETRGKLNDPSQCFIDMKSLIEACDIHYISKELPDNISGASMTTDDGKKVIVVNKDHNENRQRFTMAHELGHLLLGHDTSLNIQKAGYLGNSEQDTSSQILFRDDKSSEGSDWREIEANHFAASLLMPKELLNNKIEKITQEKSECYLSELDVCNLAKTFRVSPISMSIRLSRLGFI